MSEAELWLKSAADAFAHLRAGKWFLAASVKDARRVVTLCKTQTFAKQMDCEREFEKDQKLAGFEDAFGNYHVALWRWVWRATPPEVIDRLNEARYDLPDAPETASHLAIAHHEYMLWRAIFVTGMKKGEGFNPAHYRYFAEHAKDADHLGDDGLFKIASQRKWNFKKAKVQVGRKPTERQTITCLLVCWLAGGLWRTTSRQQQMDAVKKCWPDFPPYSLEAITTAQKRLGLRWHPAPA